MALTRPRSYQLLDSDIKASCRAATAANVTLSGGAPDVLDSVVNLVVGDRVLVKDQSTGSQNGIYVVQTVGTGSNGTWVRASDFNATNKISSGIIVYIEEGTVYGDRVYSLTTDNPITLGSTSLAWSLISGAGGGTTPGGSTGHVQYNSSSLFAGSANFTFDGSNVDLAGYIDAANLRVGTSGNTISSTDTNGNILLTPNGTGMILANANVTAPVFISNVGPGTAPFTVTSTTQVANLNVATAGTAGSATTAGTVTTAAQPNITSVGNLTIANISNIQINNNTVAAADTNGNLSLNSNGTGKVFISTLDSGGGRLVLSGTSGSVTDSSFFTYTSNSLLVNGNVTASTLVSNIAIGTAPLTVTSTTQVANLNVATAGTAGTVTTAAQPNITSVGTLTSLTATGNVTGGNLVTAGKVYSSEIIDGGTGIYLAAGPSGYINFFTTGGDKATITDAGNIVGSNLIANSTVFATTVNVSGNVTASTLVSNIAIGTAPLTVTSTTQVANLNVATAGTVTTAAQPNITSVGNLTIANIDNIQIDGNTISSTNTNGNIDIGPNGTGIINFNKLLSVAAVGGDEGGEILLVKPITNTTIAGTGVRIDVYQNRLRFWEDGGTNRGAYIDLTAAGAGLGSNLLAGGGGTPSSIVNGTSNVSVAASGNVTVGVAGTANIAVFTSTGANITGTLDISGVTTASRFVSNIAIGTAPFTVTSTTQVANLNVATAGTATSATTAGTVTTAAQGNITSVGTLTGLTVSGSIVPNANGTIQLGGTSARWSNIWGLSSSAQYADLAENYESDAHYDPATVVVFGGEKEITASTITHDPKVAGVISTQPAYLMNDDSSRSGTWLPVALQGRVPCKVKGPVSKGDIVVTSDIPGVAEKINKILYEPGSVIGKSLEHHLGTDIKIIEVVVGRF